MKGAILVTGGASGIGRAVVDAVIAGGWRAASSTCPGPNLDGPPRRLRSRAPLHRAVDVTDEAAVTDEVAAVERDFGPIDGVVTCAGFGRDVPFLATTTEAFRAMVEVNLLGTFTVAREAARAMRAAAGRSSP